MVLMRCDRIDRRRRQTRLPSPRGNLLMTVRTRTAPFAGGKSDLDKGAGTSAASDGTACAVWLRPAPGQERDVDGRAIGAQRWEGSRGMVVSARAIYCRSSPWAGCRGRAAPPRRNRTARSETMLPAGMRRMDRIADQVHRDLRAARGPSAITGGNACAATSE